jgi:hypothetical protein
MIYVASLKGNLIKNFLTNDLTTMLSWILVVLLSVNTVLNLFSLSSLESLIFTPSTLVLALLYIRLSIE